MINYIKKVIDSCENHDELDTAIEWVYNLYDKGIITVRECDDFHLYKYTKMEQE